MESASIKILDIDGDGHDEFILRNDRLYAVVSPASGARLIYLFVRTPRGGALVVGNPTDDWNFQEDLNRYMDTPSNHPGALADAGHVHDRYRPTLVEADGTVLVEMTNVEEDSPLLGTTKSFLLSPDAPALAVRYGMPAPHDTLETDVCLSPDYYRLLRRGRQTVKPFEGVRRRGYRNGDIGVWACLAADEATSWGEPESKEVGHGFVLRVTADAPTFHLLLGYGEAGEEECLRLLERERRTMRRYEETAITTSEVVE
jgi:starch synthase